MTFSILPVDRAFLSLHYAQGGPLPARCRHALKRTDFANANVKLAKNSKLKSDVMTDMRDRNFATLPASKFDEFFNDYYLLQFANPKGEFSKLRHEIRVLLKNGVDGPPHADLNNLTFNMMKAIVKGPYPDEPDYHAMQYNAVLVIGEPQRTGTGQQRRNAEQAASGCAQVLAGRGALAKDAGLSAQSRRWSAPRAACRE